jgi:hypothetical protein
VDQIIVCEVRDVPGLEGDGVQRPVGAGAPLAGGEVGAGGDQAQRGEILSPSPDGDNVAAQGAGHEFLRLMNRHL